MTSPLPSIKGIFVSNIHCWGIGKKAKWVWKVPAEKRNSGEMVLRGRLVLGRHRGFWPLLYHCPAAAASYFLPLCAEKLLGSPGTACPAALLLLGKLGCSPGRAGAAGASCGSRTRRAGLRLLGMGSRRRGSPLRQAPSLRLQVTCSLCLMLESVDINQNGQMLNIFKNSWSLLVLKKWRVLCQLEQYSLSIHFAARWALKNRQWLRKKSGIFFFARIFLLFKTKIPKLQNLKRQFSTESLKEK